MHTDVQVRITNQNQTFSHKSFKKGKILDASGQSWKVPKASLKVGGRLHYFVTNWEQISDDSSILRVLSEGYKIEFLEKPPSFSGVRHAEIPKDAEKNIILEEVRSLLEKKI